jgi:hypothetical protein
MRLFGNRHIKGPVLTEYLDSYLSPARREKVEAHLGVCPRCRQEADSLRSTISTLRSVFQAQPQRSFVFRNAPDLTPYTPPARARVPTWAAGLAASAAVLALVTVVSIDILGGLSSSGNKPVDTAALPQDGAQSAETYRDLTDSQSDANGGSDSPTSPSETNVPSKRKGAAPGVTEIITTGDLPEQPAPTEVAVVPDPLEDIAANTDQAAIETTSLSGDSATSIYWRILEGLLTAGAAVLAVLFFKKWRGRSRQAV